MACMHVRAQTDMRAYTHKKRERIQYSYPAINPLRKLDHMKEVGSKTSVHKKGEKKIYVGFFP